MSKKKKIIFSLITLLLLVTISLVFLLTSIKTTILNNDITISVPKGSSTKAISKILYENNIIKSKVAFTAYIKTNKYTTKLRSGKFFFSKGKLSFKDITDKLINGGLDDSNTINVTIPEGYTVLQIAELLESKKLVNKENFLTYAANMDIPYDYIEKTGKYTQLEGFLFPDTYNISLKWTEKEIINAMIKQFDSNWSEEYTKRAKELGYSIKGIITIASLIEREAKLEEERPIISGVIYNRLNSDMLLQIDATIQYALGKQKEKLYYSDLEIKSPYNTYLNKGLPPTPIATPGISCIKAALYPADTAYFYYRTKNGNSGGHNFAETFSEHLENKNK